MLFAIICLWRFLYFYWVLFTSRGIIIVQKIVQYIYIYTHVHIYTQRKWRFFETSFGLGNKVIFYVFILFSDICPRIHANPGGTIFPIMVKVFLQSIQLQLQFEAYADFGSNSGDLMYFYILYFTRFVLCCVFS